MNCCSARGSKSLGASAILNHTLQSAAEFHDRIIGVEPLAYNIHETGNVRAETTEVFSVQ
jgi:hypothetical protein